VQVPNIKPAQRHKYNTNTETVRTHNNKTLNTQIKGIKARGKKYKRSTGTKFKNLERTQIRSFKLPHVIAESISTGVLISP
jgi:hypothetical protein